jgi:hypothetical protein
MYLLDTYPFSFLALLICDAFLPVFQAAEFVRHMLKLSSIQYRIFPEQKKWTGWDLNPRPQQCPIVFFLVLDLNTQK